jgi:hypothetical protein
MFEQEFIAVLYAIKDSFEKTICCLSFCNVLREVQVAADEIFFN